MYKPASQVTKELVREPAEGWGKDRSHVVEIAARLQAGRHNLRSRLISWSTKGVLAIVDQALISGSNFLISILLARWLSVDEYGAYALAFGIFVLLTLIYGAIVLEPMLVFGGSSYRSSQRSYVGSLGRIHAGITALVLILVGGAALLLHSFEQASRLSGALLGVAIASPCVLTLWLLRRVCYLRAQPGIAASGATLYCASLVCGLVVFNHYRALSPFTAFLLIAFGAILASLMLSLRLLTALPSGEVGPGLRVACRKHWSYGRWALAACFASWVPTYIFYALLSAFSGIARAGELRALMNFFSPLDQTLGALSMLFLPYAARVSTETPGRAFTVFTKQISVLALLSAAAYWAIIMQWRYSVFHLLYSSNYDRIVGLLPLLAIGSMFWTAAYAPAIALRAMESPFFVFLGYSAATLISLLVGIPATRAYGLKGAIWGSNAADITTVIAILLLLRKRLREATASSLRRPSTHGDTFLPTGVYQP